MRELSDIKWVKHNRTRVKADKVDVQARSLREFFAGLEGKVKGLKGYAITWNEPDRQELLILTFWETKQDMDAFYNPNNKAVAEFVERSKHLLEQTPERRDYKIVEFKM